MARVLRPGGHLLVLDFSLPPAPLRWIYRPYLHHVLPLLAQVLTGQKAAYEYLGDSIEQFPAGAAMCGLLGTRAFALPTASRSAAGSSRFTPPRGREFPEGTRAFDKAGAAPDAARPFA